MNDAEINGIAQGMMMYLMEQCKFTFDAHAVIICIALLYYERAKAPNVDYPIEEFANDYAKDMIKFWNERQITPKGSDTLQ